MFVDLLCLILAIIYQLKHVLIVLCDQAAIGKLQA